MRLWDAVSGRSVGQPLIGHADTVWVVVYSPDGERLASDSRDQTVRLCDAVTGQPVGEPLAGHIGVVCDAAFSPDSQRLASASYVPGRYVPS